MNMKLVGVVLALTSVAVVACGDSGSSTGSGGAGSGGGTTTSTGGAAGTGGSTTNGSGGGGGGVDCETEFAAGYEELAGLVYQYCGCTAGGACEAECLTAADPACDDPPGTPGTACQTCVAAEADMGAGSTCVATAAFSTECSGSADCSAFVTCASG